MEIKTKNIKGCKLTLYWGDNGEIDIYPYNEMTKECLGELVSSFKNSLEYLVFVLKCYETTVTLYNEKIDKATSDIISYFLEAEPVKVDTIHAYGNSLFVDLTIKG